LNEAEKLAARKLVDGGLNELRCSSANRKDLKGSLARDFRSHFFFMNQCPPGPQVHVPLGPF
jgi:hypothetical protein